MKNVLLLALSAIVLEVPAKDKIVGALNGANRKLGASDISRIYGSLKDEELIPELVDLRNGKGRVSKENFERVFAYGLDKELVERAEKSEPLQKELLARIED